MLREVAAGARNLTVEECAYTPCYCEENVYLLCKELVRRGLAAPDASDLLVAFISNYFKMVILFPALPKPALSGLPRGPNEPWDKVRTTEHLDIMAASLRENTSLEAEEWGAYRTSSLGLPRDMCAGPKITPGSQLSLPSLLRILNFRQNESSPQECCGRHNVEGNQPLASTPSVGPARPPQVWDLDSDLPFPVAAPQYVHQALQGGGPSPLELTLEFVRLFRVVNGPQFMREFASDRSHMRDDLGGWMKPPPPYSPIIGQGGKTNTMPKYAQITESMVCAIPSHVQDAYISHLETKPYGEVVSESDFCRLLGVQI